MLATHRAAISSYRKSGVAAEVGCASPHRVVLMLFDGALDRLAVASGAMSRGDTATKGSEIGIVLSIIESLRQSLDFAGGGEVAVNLDRLYEYMTRTLLRANLSNDPARLAEVRKLIGELREGWSEMTVREPA